MIDIHDKQLIPKRFHKSNLDKFFSDLFLHFKKELNKTIRVFYKKVGNEDVESQIFEIIERTWLGIFNNALIRFHGNKITTLQEFSVWSNEGRSKGRCDFLINWEGNNIIIEAKREPFINDWTNPESKSYYIDKVNKLKEIYYQPLKSYITNPIGIILVFEFVKDGDLPDAQKAVDYICNKPINKTNFCALFHNRKQGVVMYGHVFELK